MIWRLQYPPYLITFLETEQKNRGYFKTASIFFVWDIRGYRPRCARPPRIPFSAMGAPVRWVEKALCLLQKRKEGTISSSFFFFCGERGIRTPGASQLNGFQDRRNRPLCHLSSKSAAKVLLFFQIHKFFAKILANMRKI